MITITRKLEFDAGHRIPDHRSQCRNLHGHRYVLEITLAGEVSRESGASDNGMVMDFADVKALANEHLVSVWDHAFLVYEGDTAVRAFLADIVGYAGWRPDEVVFVIDGVRYPAGEEQLAGSYFGQMRSYFMARAQQAGFEVIDMDPRFFARFASGPIEFEFAGDGHWNGLAHGIDEPRHV